MNKYLITCLFLLISSLVFSAELTNPISFSPSKNAFVVVNKKNDTLLVTTTFNDTEVLQSFPIENEAALDLQVKDYNFDGYKDFSISYTDLGMGTYKIYNVYIFDYKNKKFEQLTPKCGDEFINLKIILKKKQLWSTYYSNFEPKTCKMNFR
ncbi:XAC2610-related protein [Iodobacter arcticus]|uniref:XAC2610-related protein n=1 Tax=Iodobacter arcticus TaxID=590593 RepID=A0ABW2QZ44_9NEIS